MEKHKCKLCFRSFSNGRALGGHMRSHMLNLPIPSKQEAEDTPPPPPPQTQPRLQPQPALPPPPELSDSAESASSASSSSEEEEEEIEERELEDEKGLCYGLRENPKRSIRLVDPEFSFAVDASSVILQDRESETESSKNPTRRRSKRTRKSGMFEQNHNHHQRHQLSQQYQKIDHHDHQEETDSFKKVKLSKLSKTESWAEPEPVSSVSDATTEEDVAFWLMMLSRDKWKRQENRQRVEKEHEEQQEDEEEDQEEEERSMEESYESEELKSSRTNVRTRGKYKCETCKKVFRSYQALGGHRASHKKVKASNNIHKLDEPESMEQENAGGTSSTLMAEKKIHECPVCFRVFSSGQALGGHKRSHVTGSSATITTTTTTTPVNKSSNKVVESLIDLNLPAPVDDDELSQIELSAVSDAEFVNSIRR